MTTPDSSSTSRRRDKSKILGSTLNIAGINQSQIDQAKETARKIMSGDSVIELPINDDTKALFTLHTIKWSDIEQLTEVPNTNGRWQEYVTAESVEDLSKTIRIRGQQTPAIGYYTQNGKIAVLSGSRRRKSCFEVKKDYLIYVANDVIGDDDAEVIAEIGNQSKSLSLVEQGKRYQQLISSGIYRNAQELSDSEGILKSKVSLAISASNLPHSLLKLFPHITALGRPTIDKLRKFVEHNNDKEIESVCLLVAEEAKSSKPVESNHPYKLNAAILNLLASHLRHKEETKKIEKFSYAALGGGTYQISVKDGETGYKFKGLNHEKLTEVEQAIAKILGDD